MKINKNNSWKMYCINGEGVCQYSYACGGHYGLLLQLGHWCQFWTEISQLPSMGMGNDNIIEKTKILTGKMYCKNGEGVSFVPCFGSRHCSKLMWLGY
jgi:hypothetical protein